jgi:hypothetical protein
MKKILKISMMLACTTFFLWQCDKDDSDIAPVDPSEEDTPAQDTTKQDPDPTTPQGQDPHPDSVAKYADLRAWKAIEGLPQTFVWFDDWVGTVATSKTSMRSLPDSVTIISNWGQPKWPLTETRKTEMKYLQQVKGTKVVVTLFSAKCGDDVTPSGETPDPIYNIGSSTDPTVIGPAIRKYAEAIYDLIIENGYDGYDWDYEPQGGGGSTNYLWQTPAQRKLFVEELSYWFGKGATDPARDRGGRKAVERPLLFLIDGEIGIRGRMDKDWLSHYVDYFVLQAYGGSNLQGRVSGVVEDMSDWISAGVITKEEVVRRTILTEDFESNATSGGGVLNMSRYIHTADGVDQQIGGFGIYRIGMDYQGTTRQYKFLPQGITNIYSIYNARKQQQ